MDERTLEKLAELMRGHIHTTYNMVMSTIQTEPEQIWHTIQDAELRIDDSHPFHQKAAAFREKLWQIAYKQIQDECALIGEMRNAIAKDDLAAAGSMSVIIDCCDEKLNELRLCATNSQINLN